jgi:hypothetical protein
MTVDATKKRIRVSSAKGREKGKRGHYVYLPSFISREEFEQFKKETEIKYLAKKALDDARIALEQAERINSELNDK